MRIEASVHGSTKRYVQDAALELSRVLEEKDDKNRTTARYVWGLGLLYRVEKAGIAIYHYNTQGSTVALTDRKGYITDRYSYEEYGKVIAHVGTSSNPFTFSGYHGVVADDNGLYFHRARYYEPGLRRFLQRDMMAGSLMDPRSMNRYAYGGGDPVNNTDPDGEFFIALLVGLVVGAAIGFTADVIIQGVTKGWDNIDWGQAGFAALEGAITGMILGGAAGALAKASWYTVMAVEASVAMAANAGVQGLAYAAGINDDFNWAEFGATAGLSLAIPGGSMGLKTIGKKWASKTTKSISRAGLRRTSKVASSVYKNYDNVLAELGTNRQFLKIKMRYAGIPAADSLGRQVWSAFKDNFASETVAGILSMSVAINGGFQ